MYMERRKARIPKSETSRWYGKSGLPQACNVILPCDYKEIEDEDESTLE